METEEMVIKLWEQTAVNTSDLTNLKAWQERQNGSLIRLEEKVEGVSNRLFTIILSIAGTFLGVIIQLVLTLSVLKGR